MTSLSDTVLAAYYERRKGGAVVYYGDEFMVAVEFDGPSGSGGAAVEMVYADKNPLCKAVWQSRGCNAKDLGTAFLAGETVEYIEAPDENEFKMLLKRFQRGVRSRGLIDIKSGLKLHEGTIN